MMEEELCENVMEVIRVSDRVVAIVFGLKRMC